MRTNKEKANLRAKAWYLANKERKRAYDLTHRSQLLKACHYTNLQPLWAVLNRKKSGKYA